MSPCSTIDDVPAVFTIYSVKASDKTGAFAAPVHLSHLANIAIGKFGIRALFALGLPPALNHVPNIILLGAVDYVRRVEALRPIARMTRAVRPAPMCREERDAVGVRTSSVRKQDVPVPICTPVEWPDNAVGCLVGWKQRQNPAILRYFDRLNSHLRSSVARVWGGSTIQSGAPLVVF
jgi:hypothetical protein